MTPEESKELFDAEHADGNIDGVLTIRFFYPENDNCSRCKQPFDKGQERIVRVANTVKGGMIAAQLCFACNKVELEGATSNGFKAAEVNGHSMLVNEALYIAIQEAQRGEPASMDGMPGGVPAA